jgi:hypothetical protein
MTVVQELWRSRHFEAFLNKNAMQESMNIVEIVALLDYQRLALFSKK